MTDHATLGEELRAQAARSRAKLGEARSALMEAATEELRRSGQHERAPRPGDLAPEFALPSARGGEIRLGDVLGRGPCVLAFYRGGW